LQGAGAEMILDSEGRLQAVSRRVSVEPPPGQAEPAEGASDGSDAPFEALLGRDVAVTELSLNLRPVELASTAEVRVRFHPNGTCDDFQIKLEDSTGAVEIVMDPVTALPQVKVTR